MNRPDITSAAVFPKLRLILQEDVEVLQLMKKNKQKGSDIYELADSLVSAKKKILEIIPSNEEGIGGVATTATSLHIEGYDSHKNKDNSEILSSLSTIEKEQMDFVQNAVVDEGMPEKMLAKLENILEIYSKITDQLNRSSKTMQINRIVL